VSRAVPHKRKLTSLLVSRLRPAPKPYLIWDTYQRGLALLVQPSGYRAYKLIYRHRNRPRWFTLGAVDALALADARKLAAELMLEVIRGKDIAAEKRAERSAGTFAELAQKYVEQHAKKRNKSWKRAAALVQRNVLPRWGQLQADAVTRADVKALMRNMEEIPMTANQTLAVTSAIFTWAVQEEIVSTNPCRGVARNPATSRERVLADAEVPLFWAAFCEAGLFGAALQVLLLMGQRPGEVTHMRQDHIADGWWTLPGAPDGSGWPGTKNGASHRVWLPQPVQRIIAELNYDDGTGFVFGQPMDLTATMRRICRELNVPRATPHDLRRTHGSTVTGLGFGREGMNRIQNHKEGGIADVYDRHRYEEENKRIMEAVASKIMTLVLGHAAPSNVVVGAF
jgi:integrase